MPVIESSPQYHCIGAPSNGASEVQTLTIGGTPTSGTFTLGFNGEETAAITWSSTNSTLISNIETALKALDSIGASDVTVEDVDLASGIGSVTITFGGGLENLALPTITVEDNSLEGTDPDVAVAQSVAGATPTARGAAEGAILEDTASGTRYINNGTATSPIWVELE